jgi:hypothetical protein
LRSTNIVPGGNTVVAERMRETMNMSHKRFRQSQETKRNLEKFTKALRDKSIEKETVDYRQFGAAHYNVGE